MTIIIISFVLGFISTKIFIGFFKGMLTQAGIVRQNYMGIMIPVGMGLVFLPYIIMNACIAAYFHDEKVVPYYILGVIAMSLAGVVDDLVGDRSSSGFKGHFKALFKGTLTTGAFKALFGGAVAFLISLSFTKDIFEIILNTLLIALATNFFNLLDLRPGRALKIYTVSSIPVLIFSSEVSRLLLGGMLSSALAYFWDDIKARTMMGDSGSNVLGASIGIIAAYEFGIWTKIAILAALILVHAVSEKYSITKIIESNRLLNYIDKLGR